MHCLLRRAAAQHCTLYHGDENTQIRIKHLQSCDNHMSMEHKRVRRLSLEKDLFQGLSDLQPGKIIQHYPECSEKEKLGILRVKITLLRKTTNSVWLVDKIFHDGNIRMSRCLNNGCQVV